MTVAAPYAPQDSSGGWGFTVMNNRENGDGDDNDGGNDEDEQHQRGDVGCDNDDTSTVMTSLTVLLIMRRRMHIASSVTSDLKRGCGGICD